MIVRTHCDADAHKVTVEATAVESDDPAAIFEAGVALIEAAQWLTAALNERGRSRIMAAHHELKQDGLAKPPVYGVGRRRS